MIHHDPEVWKDPDLFDPDRWLRESDHGPTSGHHYVPFGWPPKACVGAGLGMTQLIVLAYLMSTRFGLTVADPASVRMGLVAVAVPLHLRGRLYRRA
jgi:cytochrome P450